MYSNGVGTAQDGPRAIALYQSACDHGEVKGCYNLGVVYDTLSELEALERWQAGQFLTVERQFAKRWRQALSGIDLRAIYNRYRPAKGMKMRDLAQAKQEADRMVQRPRDYSTLQFALDVLGGAADQRSRIVARWRSNGEPPLAAFAPYAAHVVAVDLLFNFGLGSDLISRDRPTNKIDMAYLYYLPFCMVFVSNDNLHARAATCFLAKDQVFLSGRELKADLAKLDAHYSQLQSLVAQSRCGWWRSSLRRTLWPMVSATSK